MVSVLGAVIGEVRWCIIIMASPSPDDVMAMASSSSSRWQSGLGCYVVEAMHRSTRREDTNKLECVRVPRRSPAMLTLLKLS
jgi:NADH:ubiquinone oxidoreductase subunit B-like Fe-S oxidoreductase